MSMNSRSGLPALQTGDKPVRERRPAACNDLSRRRRPPSRRSECGREPSPELTRVRLHATRDPSAEKILAAAPSARQVGPRESRRLMRPRSRSTGWTWGLEEVSPMEAGPAS